MEMPPSWWSPSPSRAKRYGRFPRGSSVRHRNESQCAEPSMAAKRSQKHKTPPPYPLVARVRGEFFEMPGLRLTCEQACRLWQVDVSTCKKLLDHLVREGSLCQTNSGFYVASETTRRRS